VQRSGLQGFFEAIEIVHGKDTVTYTGLVNKHKIVKTQGWMIGNSRAATSNPRHESRPQRRVHPAPDTWHRNTNRSWPAPANWSSSQFPRLRSHF